MVLEHQSSWQCCIFGQASAASDPHSSHCESAERVRRRRGVLEVIARHDGDTFRAVYTVRFADAVYVLHVLQKKSKRGIATPKKELDLIRQRLKLAEQEHRQWTAAGSSVSKDKTVTVVSICWDWRTVSVLATRRWRR
jgi:Phage derived protein Gp49-like (DUF891)